MNKAIEEVCCTPIGQIKRYVDCKGCDRKPKQDEFYSEEDMKTAFKVGFSIGYGSDVHAIDEKNRTCDEWFEQFKKE